MDVAIFVLALSEIRTHNLTNKNEIQLPHVEGPMEQLSDSSGLCEVQFHHKWAAPRACLSVVWGLRAWACPTALENHRVPTAHPSSAASVCPSQMLPFATPAGATAWLWQTLSILMAKQIAINIWEMHPSFFQWHEWGTVSFSVPSFSIPSHPPAVGFLPFIQRWLFFPQDCVGAFGLTWSSQAEINRAEYLWSCFSARADSGCAKFRKLTKKKREKMQTQMFLGCACVRACAL